MENDEIAQLRKQLYLARDKNNSLQLKLKAALAENKRQKNYFQNNFNHLETGTSTPEPPA